MAGPGPARQAGLVSIVIPTRDSGRTIAACVASARAQRGAPIEVVVVDNHSTDGTARLALDHGADRVLVAGPERSAQRNRGLEASTGEFVVFVDSDMVLDPEVAAGVRTVLAEPGVGAAVLPERSFGEGYLAGCRVLEKRLYLGLDSAEAARAFRAGVLDRAGGYDEGLFAFEDYELADRVRSAGWRIARTRAGVRHDEGRVRLGNVWRKKRYYGSQWGLLAPGQLDRSRRRRLPLRPAVVASDPLHVPGLVLLKLVDVAGLLAGRVEARRRRPARPAAAGGAGT